VRIVLESDVAPSTLVLGVILSPKNGVPVACVNVW
jgi:hypothetical protein